MNRRDRSDRGVSQGIGRAREGDADALAVLYVRYRRSVQAHVEAIVRDPYQAEDITQQVFAKLPGALRSYEERSVSFSAWILRVARNAALDDLRARRRHVAEPLDADEPEYDAEAALDRLACLREALAGLPCDQRRVVLLRDVVGLSAPEVAQRLGRTEGAIHAMHHRGRTGLRRSLGELGLAPATC
jgi:RNA polymerase sigma-70 factor (ECF subfamily)